MGSGTTAGVAVKHGRHYLGCELNPEYFALHDGRIRGIVEGKPKKKTRTPVVESQLLLTEATDA
jgi:DNA modification methylase